MPARLWHLAVIAELQMNLRVGGEKVLRHAHNGGGRRGDPEIIQKYRRDPFIHQNPAMLRIIEEFNHIGVAVGCFEQMRLRSAAHFSNQTASVGWHGGGNRVLLGII